MKDKLVLLLTILLLATSPSVSAVEETTKRRPDRAEFVTESHVRLTTESLTIAEITESSAASESSTSFWDYVTQSFSAFINSLRDIFNLRK